jgi:hypothetical protein
MKMNLEKLVKAHDEHSLEELLSDRKKLEELLPEIIFYFFCGTANTIKQIEELQEDIKKLTHLVATSSNP